MKLNEQLAVISPEDWITISTEHTLYIGLKSDIPNIFIERDYEVLKIASSSITPRFIISVKEV